MTTFQHDPFLNETLRDAIVKFAHEHGDVHAAHTFGFSETIIRLLHADAALSAARANLQQVRR